MKCDRLVQMTDSMICGEGRPALLEGSSVKHMLDESDTLQKVPAIQEVVSFGRTDVGPPLTHRLSRISDCASDPYQVSTIGFSCHFIAVTSRGPTRIHFQMQALILSFGLRFLYFWYALLEHTYLKPGEVIRRERVSR